MTKPELIGLVDMDGTLCDYAGAMTEDLKKLHSPKDKFRESWEYYEMRSVPKHVKARMRLIKSQPGWWENLPKFKLGFDVVDALLNESFSITILTKGPDSNSQAWAEKHLWCKANLKFPYKITMTQDKGTVYGKVLVDDYEPYVKSWLEWRPRGLVVMPAHPWNKKFRHPQVFRYDGKNHKEMISRIKNIAGSEEC